MPFEYATPEPPPDDREWDNIFNWAMVILVFMTALWCYSAQRQKMIDRNTAALYSCLNAEQPTIQTNY